MTFLDNIKKYIYDIVYPKEGEIWLFHSVTNERATDPMMRLCEVTPAFLEEHILEAMKRGYHFVSMDDVYEHLKFGKKMHKYIAITLDDGYENNYSIAYPIFKKYNVPFCIYVTTGFIEGVCNVSETEKKRMMSMEQLIEVARDPLCTIGAHTLTHPHLRLLSVEEQERELRQSREILRNWTNQPIEHVACPYGDYDNQTKSVCRQVGFVTAVAAWGKPFRKNKKYDLFDIPRIIMML